MRTVYDLSALAWRVSPSVPWLWEFQPFPDLDSSPEARPIPAKVPGSVQASLRAAGQLADWNVGQQARLCEWVENRHWIYEVRLPDDWFAGVASTGGASTSTTTPAAVGSRTSWRLACEGLDYSGWVFLNGREAGSFRGSHVPHRFDLTAHVAPSGNLLRIVFDLPPRWLGQFGHTSAFRDWKVRFNYTWDWVPRLVQIGFTGPVTIEATDGAEISDFRCTTDADPRSATSAPGATQGAESAPHASGMLRAWGRAVIPPASPEPSKWQVHLNLWRLSASAAGELVRRERMAASQFTSVGVGWRDLAVELWQPNGGTGSSGKRPPAGTGSSGKRPPAGTGSSGKRPPLGAAAASVGGRESAADAQPLYQLECELFDPDGRLHDRVSRTVGFRHVEWRPCEGATQGADPWLCVVNGAPTFLQGVNYPPVLPFWADVTRADHDRLLRQYRDLGVNVLRINACGYLESTDFYELCDEYGILVWQEFPLTSSGVENTPPADPQSIGEMSAIARSFIARRQHHPSLAMWGGGNELLDAGMKPYDLGHPMLAALGRVVAEEDAGRRYVPTSPSGPRFGIEEPFIGKGLHWDVHGPWKPKADLAEWTAFWKQADALFYSEIGAPGASPAALIRAYAGELAVMPVDPKNPLYCLTLSWWTEHERFQAEHGRPPRDLEEYVAWSQERQARTLAVAMRACKDRFPACGGAILWCGHDCFPCAVNTSIIDFEGRPKPAALALKEVWLR